MPSKSKKYSRGVKSNRDLFLVDVMNSAEFKEVKSRLLPKNKYFTGINHLLGRLTSDPTGRALENCAEEISKVFKIKKDTITKLLLSHKSTLRIDLDYMPRITSDDSYVYLRLGPKTSQQDVMDAWRLVKDEQRKIGKVGSKASINPELAFCIHRQLVIKDRKMKDVFNDYQNGKLEGYSHFATINDIDDFRKYYSRSTEGLLIR